MYNTQYHYRYVAESIKGPLLIKLGPVEVGPSGEIRYHPERSELSGGNIPLILSSGVLTCQTPAGAMVDFISHYPIIPTIPTIPITDHIIFYT